MNFLKAIDLVQENDYDMIDSLIFTLEKRRDDIEIREPVDFGSRYDKWEEKLKDIEDILLDFENLKECEDKEKRKAVLDRIKKSVEMHQLFYKGLKRLKI